MEKDARYFVVGVFVTVAMTMMFAFLIWIAGTHDMKKYNHFTIYFTDAVGGLKEGASVQYKGVEVGKVTNVRLAPERKDLIKVDIQVEQATPVRGGTKANLAMMGVTGFVYVDMTTELSDTSRVPYIKGEKYPVIQGSGTSLAKALENVPEISKQLLELSKKMNVMLDDNNLSEFSAILVNLENMSKDFNGLLSDDNVKNVSTSLDNFAKFSIDMQDIASRFDETADQIDKTADVISQMVKRNEANVNKFTQEGLDQIISMSRETRKAAESIKGAADMLTRDPSQIIYKPSKHGVEIAK